MFILNVALFVFAMTSLPNYVYPLFSSICALLLVGQVSRNTDTSANGLVWLIVIALMPFFGAALYTSITYFSLFKSKEEKISKCKLPVI